jgi:hypothetical protein
VLAPSFHSPFDAGVQIIIVGSARSAHTHAALRRKRFTRAAFVSSLMRIRNMAARFFWQPAVVAGGWKLKTRDAAD